MQLFECVQKRLGTGWNGGDFELGWGFSGGVLQRNQVVTLGGAILSALEKPELRPDVRAQAVAQRLIKRSFSPSADSS